MEINITEEKAFKRYKFKAFLWDQFILPLKMIFNIKHIKTALLVIAIFNTLVFRNYLYSFIVPWILLLILILYDDIYKSWKSGEFIKNYKDHKYPEYRKAIKEVRKARKERLNSSNSITNGETNTLKIIEEDIEIKNELDKIEEEK